MKPSGSETRTEPVRAERESAAEVNGIDTAALFHAIEDIKADPTKASCKFAATTQWRHGTVSTCRIDHYELGGEMDLEGELDLRGFLGIDEDVGAGYEELTLVCRVQGDGTLEQYQACLEAGTRYAPNFQTITRAVPVHYRVDTQ